MQKSKKDRRSFPWPRWISDRGGGAELHDPRAEPPDDPGIKTYVMRCGAVIRFNPCDPELLKRREQLADKLNEYGAMFKAQAQKVKPWNTREISKSAELYRKCNAEIRSLLPWVYGPWNEKAIAQYFYGRSVFEPDENGRAIIQSFEDELRFLVKNK